MGNGGSSTPRNSQKKAPKKSLTSVTSGGGPSKDVIMALAGFHAHTTKSISDAKTHQELIDSVRDYYCNHMANLNKKSPEKGKTPYHDDWGYAKHGADWNIKGSEQSPIAVDQKSVIFSATHFMKVWWNQKNIKTIVVDNGHTLMVTAPVSRMIGVNEDRKVDLFEALQFHFHDPSEHTIDGIQYPLELHIVHTIVQGHFDENIKRKLAVIGIFFEIDDKEKPNEFLEALKLDNIGEEVELNFEKYFGHIEMPEFYHYKGSLTTPPCSEIVNWFVISTPMKMTTKQLESFSIKRFGKEKFGGNGNNRIVQPTNERKVFCGNCHRKIDLMKDFE